MVELAVGDYETGLSIQLWKFYQDVFELRLISPGGEQTTLGFPVSGRRRHSGGRWNRRSFCAI